MVLMASCQPYEDIQEAIDDPEEASYAYGTLNDAYWEANAQVGLNSAIQKSKGKVLFYLGGILSYTSDLYYDVFAVWQIPWLPTIGKIDLNKDKYADIRVAFQVVEYDVAVVRYELDKTQENYLKMSPMWGSADYTGELEVHLVKTWSVDYAPPTPDTLHLVVEEFRATHVK